jgi:hypothetical protein
MERLLTHTQGISLSAGVDVNINATGTALIDGVANVNIAGATATIESWGQQI